MKAIIDHISIQIPLDFEDWSTYNYISPDENESLEIMFVENESDISCLKDLVSFMREGLLDHYEGGVAIVSEKEISLQGSQGMMMALAGGEGRDRLEQWLLFLQLADQRFVYLDYSAIGLQPEAPTVSQQIFASVGQTFEAGREPQQVDFVWRFARELYFAVPSRLIPPEDYEFRSYDEQSALTIAVYTPGRSKYAPRLIDEEIKEDAKKGRLEDSVDLTCPETAIYGIARRYRLIEEDRSAPKNSLVYRAQVFFASGVRIHLCLNGPEETMTQMDENWLSIINSLAEA